MDCCLACSLRWIAAAKWTFVERAYTVTPLASLTVAAFDYFSCQYTELDMVTNDFFSNCASD